MKYNYSDYTKNINKLFTKLFGEKTFKKLNNTPFNTIEWDGIDLTCDEITATTPNIKDRFTKEWGEYFTERDYTMFDLFISSVFHYGYQQKCDNIRVVDKGIGGIDDSKLIDLLLELSTENKLLKEEIETLKNK